MDGLSHLGVALAALAAPWQIGYALGATLCGILIGLLPGLSATLGVALFTTLTVKLPPTDAILILVCVYVGAIYGGSRTAILLNIPGTAANAAACLDGHQLARQGRAGRAMGIATTGSVAGSLFGVICLAMFTPYLAETALAFGAYEFFWLGMVGVMMSGTVTGAAPLKGWLMGLLGIFVATIGLDPIHAQPRFTFGENAMTGGIGLIPALVGAFGFAEILTAMSEPRRTAAAGVDAERWRKGWELKVFGYINLTRAIYPLLKARGGGVIINNIGAGGDIYDARYICGTAGNASLMAFSRTLGGRSLDDGIRVVGLNPGTVNNERIETFFRQRAADVLGDAERYKELFAGMPGGRAAANREIADAIIFLASPRSSYTTGTIVTVDGGLSCRHTVA